MTVPTSLPMAYTELERFQYLVQVSVGGALAVLVMDGIAQNGVGVVLTIATLCAIALTWILAKRGRVALATQLFAGALLMALTHLVWRFGGAESGLLPWLLMPFFAVVFTRDLKQSVPWAVMAIPAAALASLSPVPPLGPWVRFTGLVIYTGLLCVGLGLFVRAKLIATERLSESIEALNQEVEQRRVAEERAVQAERAQTEFLATMSHEIRTPLSGVLSMAELLSKAELPAEQASQVGVLRQSGSLLMRVVNEVLDLSKFKAGLISLEPAPCQLGQLVQGTVALHRPSAEAKGLSLEVASFMDLPGWVSVDGVRLQQVLGNLLRNAIQHTERGGVVVGLSWSDEVLELSVTDSGPGISPAAQEHIFDRYGQAEDSMQGTGLGLAIVGQICRAMSGSVAVTSALGQGSAFLCTLPVARCSKPAKPPPSGPRRLLVVDDQEVNRDILRLLLESRGHRVFVACSGQEALDVLRGGGLELDLMICDLHMPTMTGWDVVEAWRQIEALEALPRLPIVGLTASILDGEHAQALRSGMDHVLTKPVLGKELERLLETYLSN